jgi:hypothetical protein
VRRRLEARTASIRVLQSIDPHALRMETFAQTSFTPPIPPVIPLSGSFGGCRPRLTERATAAPGSQLPQPPKIIIGLAHAFVQCKIQRI